jgi:hypothetical protein
MTDPAAASTASGLTLSRWQQARSGATVLAAFATMTAALTLIPLFDSVFFLVPVLIVVLAIAAMGWIARFLGLPAIVHPIAAAVVWVTMLTWIFVLPEATWWIVPGPDAIEALRSLTQLGISEAEVIIPPVPSSAALLILAAGGVGIIAIIVDVIGVTLRLPAIAAAPLLVLISLPIALLPQGLPWWYLPIAASGWLALVAADTRSGLLTWGPVATVGTPSSRRGAGPQAHRRRARPIGFDPRIVTIAGGAIILAVLAPLAIPGLSEPVWGTGRGGTIIGGTAAGEGPVSLDPFVSLRRNLVNNSNEEVVRYTTDAAEPGYLRMVTLTEFDGVTWRSNDSPIQVPLTQPLPPPVRTPGTAVSVHRYDLEVGDLTNRQLPVPFAATSVRGALGGDWSWDPTTRTVSSPSTSAAGLTYSVSAYEVRPTRAQLRSATAPPSGDLAALTDLPADLSPLVGDLARQIVAGQTVPYRQALALEKWFTVDGGFTYSTSIDAGGGSDPVAAFLNERVGYCEQFAASMALMARSLGIPARVNVGFTSGTRNTDGSWSVRGRNAHAWPELWFDGLGWVWFEPTPRSDGEQAGVVAPPYSDVPDRNLAPDVPPVAPPVPPPVDVDAAAGTTTPALPPAWLVAALIAVVAAIVGPAAVRWARRRHRIGAAEADMRIEGAWRELSDTAHRYGLTPSGAQTPREYVVWLRQRVAFDDDSRQSLLRLLWWVEQSRYAANLSVSDTPSRAHLRDALASVQRAISNSRSRPRRWKAWWFVHRVDRAHRDTSYRGSTARGLGRDPARGDAASDLRVGP